MRWAMLGVVLFLPACQEMSPKHICEGLGGKWGSVKSTCYRPSCVKNGTCKDWNWANSSDYCPKVSLGMDKSTVVFWLGNPIEQNYPAQNTLTWSAHKESNDKITATFVDEKLTQFECPH